MDKSNIGTQTKTALEARHKAESYEGFIGRWARVVARDFVLWLAVPQGRSWLDLGCRTGAVTQAILQYASPKAVRAIDPNEDYINYVKFLFTSDNRATFGTSDYNLLFDFREKYDAVVSGAYLNFTERPGIAIDAMKFAVEKDGLVGAFVWDYTGKMEMLRHFWDAAMELDPAVSAFHESFRYTVGDEGSLRKHFADNGLRNLETRQFEITMRFRNFEEYWLPFRGGQGPAAVYLNSLDTAQRDQIKERLQNKIPVGPDGEIGLVARAWGIKGYK